MKKRVNLPDHLVYDIETSLMSFVGFRLGEQRLGPSNIMDGRLSEIICISYAVIDGLSFKVKGKIEVIDWGSKCDSQSLIKDFDNIVRPIINAGGMIIGKNNVRFDMKHVNTQRMLHNLSPLPEWVDQQDDVEKMLRKTFYLPSYALDYFSKLIGTGGKNNMDFSHWKDIKRGATLLQLPIKGISQEARDEISNVLYNIPYSNVINNYYKSLIRMKKYNKKDVSDTIAVLKKIAPHCKLKFNASALSLANGPSKTLYCKHCGSSKLVKKGMQYVAKLARQRYACNNCGSSYAATGPIL